MFVIAKGKKKGGAHQRMTPLEKRERGPWLFRKKGEGKNVYPTKRGRRKGYLADAGKKGDLFY